MEFYRKTIKSDAGPSPEHGGYYVRGAGDPPPFKKYRAWIPAEMMDSLDMVPELLAMESNDRMNEESIKIIGSSPSTSSGFVVYFEVSPTAASYLASCSAGVMCGAHKLKFSLVNDTKSPRMTSSSGSTPRSSSSAGRTSPSSGVENWRTPSPEPASRSPTLFYRPNKSPFLSTVEETTGQSEERTGHSEERRNSAPDALNR